MAEEILNSTGQTFAVESYPTHIRGRALGLIVGPTYMGGVLSNLFGKKLLSVNVRLPFMLNGGMSLAAAALMYATLVRGGAAKRTEKAQKKKKAE